MSFFPISIFQDATLRNKLPKRIRIGVDFQLPRGTAGERAPLGCFSGICFAPRLGKEESEQSRADTAGTWLGRCWKHIEPLFRKAFIRSVPAVVVSGEISAAISGGLGYI